jgi:hypothetical protein
MAVNRNPTTTTRLPVKEQHEQPQMAVNHNPTTTRQLPSEGNSMSNLKWP